jgi:pyruvate/2-oxoglutarate dehydrogenase complex dihydrolipoamide acyltransferase (E2) component
MVIEVTMPKWGLMMQQARIVEWYKKEGEQVGKGEALCKVETEKVLSDVEVPEAGTLKKIYYQAGQIAAVAEVIAEIETD